MKAGSAQTDTATSGPLGAVTSFLLNRETLLPLLASRLGGEGAVFESAIRGDSMSPAIPGRARLRVQLLSGQRCRSGDIVFYLCDDGFMVHRIIYQSLRGSSRGHLLTLGDNCLVPDPPVNDDRLLGRVVAVQTESGWRAPGPSLPRSIHHRVVRGLTSVAVILALRCNVTTGRAVQRVLRKLETAGLFVIRQLRRGFGVSLVSGPR